MNKNTMAWIVIIAGAVGYFIPQWQGIFFDSSDITLGEGRIIGTIMFIGGLILLYLPEEIKLKNKPEPHYKNMVEILDEVTKK